MGSAQQYIVFVLLAICVKTSLNDCPPQFASGVQWTASASNPLLRYASSPLCLSDNLNLQTRQCVGSAPGVPLQWLPSVAPQCVYTQIPFDESNHCPFGLDQLRAGNSTHGPLCAVLHSYASWSEKLAACSQYGSTRHLLDIADDPDARADLDALREYTRQHLGPVHASTAVYLPAKWIEPNRVWWQVPGALGQIQRLSGDDHHIAQAMRPGNGCATVRFGSSSLRLAKRSCDDDLPMLCVYAERSPLLALACPAGRFSTRYASGQTRCSGVESVQRQQDVYQELFKLTDVQQTVIAQHLMSRLEMPIESNCTFDAFADSVVRYNSINTAVWYETVGSSLKTFVNWNVDTVYTGAQTTDLLMSDVLGRWSIGSIDEQTCVLVSNELIARLSADLPQIVLGFASDTTAVLRLVVHAAQWLWRLDTGDDDDDDDDGGGVHCFHADDQGESVRSVDIVTTVATVQELLESNVYSEDIISAYNVTVDGVGFYWCEAYAIQSMSQIASQPVYIDRADTFAGVVWRQVDFVNATVDLPEWLHRAVDAAQQTGHIRIEDVRVRSVRAAPPQRDAGAAHFLRISFSFSVRFITGEPFVAADELLHFTDANILRVLAKHDRVLLALNMPPFHFPAINSTEFCMPELRTATNETLWPGARIGELHTATEICWVAVGEPALRRCVGDGVSGAAWLDVSRQPCIPTVVGEATQQLHNMSVTFQHRNQTAELFGRVRRLTAAAADGDGITVGVQQLSPFDVISIGNIMERAAVLNNVEALDTPVVNDMLSIYDDLMALNVNCTRTAARLNATNILLAALDAMLGNLTPPEEDSENELTPTPLLSEQREVFEGKRQHFTVYLIDPSRANVTGIAMMTGGNEIRYLFGNQSIPELFELDSRLEVAVFLPPALLETLPVLVQLVIGVFDNDVLFQAGDNAASPVESGVSSKYRLQSRVISVSIPNVDTASLLAAVPIFFRHNASVDPLLAKVSGGFWPLDNRRVWLPDGFVRVQNTSNIVQYNATHLTNFALIIRDNLVFSEQDSANLFIITVVGIVLSMVGIMGIFLTALRFSTWRTKASNQLLLQLSMAIAAMLLLFLFADNRQALAHPELCIAMGAMLHYLVLVTFVWMLVMAYLQFMRYVVVFVQMRSDQYVLKLSCISWSVPLIPVVVVLIVDPNLYVPPVVVVEDGVPTSEDSNTTAGMCYPTGYAMYAGLMAPIGLIIVCNVLVFVMVIYNLLQVQMPNRSIVLAQLRVSTFLFFLLGLTWIFGFFSHAEGPSVLFAYLFCATATLQGLVLFVYFVVLEPGTRQMWTNDFRAMCGMRRKGSMTLEVVA